MTKTRYVQTDDLGYKVNPYRCFNIFEMFFYFFSEFYWENGS